MMHAHKSVNMLAARLKSHVSVEVQKCYQCGKCTAGCPLNSEMDIAPNRVMRLLQLRDQSSDETLLKSYSIWVCLGCGMCLSRCPMSIDIPAAMDYMRAESVAQKKVNPKARSILAFHRSFLQTIKSNGRLYEAGLIAGYKLRTMQLTNDVALAPYMLSKSKLHFLPERIKDKLSIRRIFKSTENKKNQDA
jgi:heterodisulfide reductase subunit C2